MNNPGQYLKSTREEKKLGVKTVYKATGVGDSTLRRIEEGKITSPSAIALKKLADYYNIDVISLYIAYGYLDESDLKLYIRCFKNTEYLNSKEKDSIQNVINLFVNEKE